MLGERIVRFALRSTALLSSEKAHVVRAVGLVAASWQGAARPGTRVKRISQSDLCD